MRHPDKILAIWVDAVCINQTDMHEKELQIQLMRDIYSGAEEVIVWLGYRWDVRAPSEQPKIYDFDGDHRGVTQESEATENNEGVEAMKGEKLYDDEDVVPGFAFFVMGALNMHAYDMPIFKADGDEVMAVHSATMKKIMFSLSSFCNATWWTRLWTYQEIILASKATILYHNVTISWDCVAGALNNIFQHDRTCCYRILNKAHPEFSGTFNELMSKWHSIEFERQRGFHGIHDYPPFTDLLTRTKWRQATNPLDKVYGLLGLLSAEDAPEMRPDYTLEPRQAFMSAAIHDLKVSQGLWSLMGIPRTDVPGLPTWVTENSSSKKRYEDQCNRITAVARSFRASGPTKTTFTVTGEVLALAGFSSFDRVRHLSPVIYERETSRQALGQTEKEHQSLSFPTLPDSCGPSDYAPNDERIYRGEQTVGDALFRTFANDIVHVGETYTRLEDSTVQVAKEVWEMGTSQLSADDSNKWGMFLASSTKPSALRRLFFTEDSRMGIGPPSMATGDEIVLFCGGCAPFCVRKEPDWTERRPIYTLVGDVYLHGVMDGEAVPENWEEKLIDIHLR
ncbi:hypothetical protein M011DRAFT_506136 [Sporormia fimetaria CBS 119925]|uniref:Heterokaryon incompatibility domain-containing protein n=1 Tax=Sporormia fimetaria CBS 119925 TaxID=1340428 RepID=A0A6A6V4Q5_9PLEO|nr:hypothetical protein M011DRAFT_506136 [Sporormia fimetaria CBS 119925]